MTRTTLLLLKIVLAVGFLGCLLAQVVVLPALAADSVAQFPEVAHLRTPYLVGTIATVLCVQGAIVAIWVLLNRVSGGTVFSSGSLPWVDVVIWCAVVAGILVLVLGGYLLGSVGGGPGVSLLTLTGVTVSAGVALLMLVLRRLLHQAMADRDELAGLI